MVLPVLVTTLVLVAVGGLVIVEQQRQVRASEDADAVAAEFLDEVAAFRDELTDLITAGREGPPTDLQAQVQARIEAPPSLPALGGVGAELSEDYRDAQYLEATLLDPYVELVDVLGRIAVARTFIAAADAVLALRIDEITGSSTIRDASVVERDVIPEYEEALSDFEAVPVPGGQEDLAATVSAAVQNVIDQCELLVAFAAVGQNYSFSYGSQIAIAAEAVRVFGLTVDSDLAAAVDAALPA
ncbi:hypothetical protein [Aeromicrobium sp. Leaf350]|uniref:hypothetical protein n=1 Tax=Aeromicrobium sp. Leaf350 TaxID=2876565 RepID=UPI001E4ADC81|nr:hypothetical protein [Aeromicrobium sp. Leaf350]